MELSSVKKYYQDFDYPESFLKILELNLLDYDVWYIMPEDQEETRIKGLKQRYPNRRLVYWHVDI